MFPKIRTGSYSLRDSGFFHLLSDKETTVEINDSLKFEISYSEGVDGKEGINIQIADENTLKIKFVNTKKWQSFGLTNFVHIGDTDEGELYLAITTRKLNDPKVRTLEYSLYVKP